MTARRTPLPPRERLGILVSDIQWFHALDSMILVMGTVDAIRPKGATARFYVWIMKDDAATLYAVEDRGEDAEHPRYLVADSDWRNVLGNSLAAAIENELHGRGAMTGPVS